MPLKSEANLHDKANTTHARGRRARLSQNLLSKKGPNQGVVWWILLMLMMIIGQFKLSHYNALSRSKIPLHTHTHSKLIDVCLKRMQCVIAMCYTYRGQGVPHIERACSSWTSRL